MKLDRAIELLGDGISRKFLLDPKTDTLHVSRKYIYREEDTHRNFAFDQNLIPEEVKGGMLKVEKGKIVFSRASTTVPTASEHDILNFHGEVEIF